MCLGEKRLWVRRGRRTALGVGGELKHGEAVVAGQHVGVFELARAGWALLVVVRDGHSQRVAVVVAGSRRERKRLEVLR